MFIPPDCVNKLWKHRHTYVRWVGWTALPCGGKWACIHIVSIVDIQHYISVRPYYTFVWFLNFFQMNFDFLFPTPRKISLRVFLPLKPVRTLKHPTLLLLFPFFTDFSYSGAISFVSSLWIVFLFMSLCVFFFQSRLHFSQWNYLWFVLGAFLNSLVYEECEHWNQTALGLNLSSVTY